ncbi:MAG TPA: hypothetical protein DEQ20_11350 [Desulfobulbaceae bacterium]|nr:MAG: hypothetical protein A2520_00385 [Deltaproteobacteria bacterium RIFOXYD12_FULL_53_23]HCC55497.1 hypothetical protein [Desulfobulbaceae bacterium]
MECPPYPSEIQGKHWLSPLGMAVALHLLLVLLGIYAPGFPRFRPEVREIYTVRLVEVAEPDKMEVEQPRTAPPVPSLPIRKTSKILRTVRPDTAISWTKPTTVGPAIAEQPAVATEVSAYGQGTVVSAPMEIGEKKGEGSGMGNSRLVAGNVNMTNPLSVGAGEDRESFRKRYFASLMAHIEANKFYPPMARRRRLEGAVQVRFTLEANGRISGLQVSEGESLLGQAAREAVERSLPLPLPSAQGEVSLPRSIGFLMEFRLR